MAIDFSHLKDALKGQDLVGFRACAGRSETATSGPKLTTSKRGGGEKAPGREALTKASTSKKGIVEKKPA
jgi:hypothetical protein